MTEQRRFSRISFHQPVKFTHAGQVYSTQLLDISLKGALFERPEEANVQLGDPCRLCVTLNPEELIEMEGEVAHLSPTRIGLKCTNIELDSITTLRCLVEMNLGDEALMQRELHALLHSHP